MSEPKIKPSDLKKIAQDLIRRGEMPPLEDVLQAVADSRKKYSSKIVDARKDDGAEEMLAGKEVGI